MNHESFDAKEYQFKNIKDQIIIIKITECFNMLRQIMSTFMNERESLHYF